jgi:serine/threonine protein kinase
MFNNLFKNSVLRKKYDFNKLEYIGGGAFGKVYKTTTLKEPQIDVIVKIQILPMQDLLNALSGDDSPFIRNEKNILNYLKKIELPKLSEFLDYEFIKESESYSFVSVYKAKYSSTLNNYLLKNTLSNKDKVSLITNLIDSVYSMHKNNLAHSDLKPHNIIIGTNETCEKDVEIIDFGLSCIKSLVSNCLYGGTPYFAPDLFKNIPKSITFQLPLWLGGGAKYDDIVTYDNYALMVCIFDILTNNKYYEDGSIQKKYQEFEKYRNDIPSKLREMMFQTFLMEEIPNAEKIKKLWEGVKKELV